MTFNLSTNEKKAILAVFVFSIMVVGVMGGFLEQTTQIYPHGGVQFVGGAPVELAAAGTVGSNPTKLKAMVKGSIYETGSNMTVYGACFDGDGYLLPEANAMFTGWYPNGSIVVGPNATMIPITDDWMGYSPNGTGRWEIHVTMDSVIGTYLTEIRCEYAGEWAVAFGEWQNPEWVQRIGQIQDSLGNISGNITQFQLDVQNNFSTVLQNLYDLNSSLSSINTSLNASIANLDNSLAIQELSQQMRAIDINTWVLDDTNPFYVLASGTHMWQAVDMLSVSQVAAVSLDGYFAMWDGTTWTEENSTYQWRGVSILPSNTQYAWAVGTNGSAMYYSINGANATLFTGSGPSPGTALNDVVLFQDSNDPSGPWFGYLLDNHGQVYYTNASGTSWTYLTTLAAAEKGRFSQIVVNYGAGAEPEGFLVMAAQNDTFGLFNASSYITDTVSGNIKDVSMLYYNKGYLVAEDVTTTKIYSWDGSSTALEYEIEDANIVPTAIEAHATNDIWVTTTDPSVFYHFDGMNWKYSAFGYSEFISVIVTLGGGGNISTDGIQDMAMVDSRHGYAVGQDGIILIYQSKNQENFNLVLDKLDQLSFNVSYNINASQIALETSVQNLTDLVLTINQSTSQDLNNLLAFLQSMNASLQVKTDNILSNVTYTNLYLNTTIYPLVSATYDNTVQILIRLGILESKINQTIELQNQTLNIVNSTATDVDELVNRSRRIRAWVTQ